MDVTTIPINSPLRLESVQVLRGVAAVMVVIAHSFTSAASSTGISHPALDILASLGASGVDLFFVISGFVMAVTIDHRSRSVRAFVRDRLVRIVPLLWLLSAVYVMFYLPHFGLDNMPMLLNSFLIVPVFDGTNYHQPVLFVGWTLAFELSFYALVACVLGGTSAAHDRVKQLMFIVIGAAAIGVFWQPKWAAARILLNPMMMEFLFGIIVYRMWRSGNWTAHAPSLMIGGIALMAMVVVNPFGVHVSLNGEAVIQNGEGLMRTVILGLPIALIFAGIVLESAKPQRTGTFFGYLGDASYSIYLTQAFVIEIVEKASATGAIRDYATIAGLIIVGSVASGSVLHLIVERPVTVRFKARKDRVPAAVALA